MHLVLGAERAPEAQRLRRAERRGVDPRPVRITDVLPGACEPPANPKQYRLDRKHSVSAAGAVFRPRG
jgi:hypothetical protein